MYKNWFFITEAVWNNAFSFEKRENKKLYVPSLKKISSFDEIEFQDEKNKIAFEDYGFDDKLSTNYGLKNFYEIEWNWKTIFLFDNHNHALYFWYLAREKGVVWDDNTLIHIDEHADTRNPEEYLLKPDSLDLQKVFDYTNFSKVNVWNYIIPAQKEGLIGEIIQLRNETNLLDYLENKDSLEENIILNLDLDFFQPDLDFIDYKLKKKVVIDAINKAKVITVATSPFFINQNLAIKVFKDLFDN